MSYKIYRKINNLMYDVVKDHNGNDKQFKILAEAKQFISRLNPSFKYHIVECGADDQFKELVKIYMYEKRIGKGFTELPDILLK